MKTSEKFIVTINRELGSGGRTIGEKLAHRLGVEFYDKALVHELTSHFNLTVEELEKVKGRKRSWWDNIVKDYTSKYPLHESFDIEPTVATTDTVFKMETKILKELGESESCVIAGRSAFHIFRDEPNVLNILIQSTMEERIKRVMNKQGLTREEAKAAIEKVDKGRENYMRETADTSRYDTRNYDIVLNVAALTEDEAVDIIMAYIDKQDK